MAFNNENKPKAKPPSFHRINSRNFNPKELSPNGKGGDCGCRSPKDYSPTAIADIVLNVVLPSVPGPIKKVLDPLLKAIIGKDTGEIRKELAAFLAKFIEGFIFAKALRSIPAWVPVNRVKFDRNFKEVEREVEGLVSRSFQSCTDLPLLPWQRFYNWNFHVRLDEGSGYQHVMGRGNQLNAVEQEDLGGVFGMGEVRESLDMLLNQSFIENSFECVLDTGAFSKPPGNFTSGPFDKTGDNLPGVMFHPAWPFWPMANDRFWAQGRWVYDCTHAREENDTELMWTQFRPLRAFATLRYEGFKFDENEKAVPASRFMFMSFRKGGYTDLPPFSKLDPADDPQFILDLPDSPTSDEITWTIGHTPDFPMNTVVLRPRLLIKTEFAPFSVPSSFFPDGMKFNQVEPQIELVRSSDQVRIPDQVKITIPLSQLPEGADAFGFVTSLGWADPAGALAARVKKVTVSLDRLGDVAPEGELRFKFGVNGRWVFAPLHDSKSKTVPLGGTSTLLLPDDAKVTLSVHGTNRHGFGEFLEGKTEKERQLRVGGLIDLGDEKLNELIKQGKEAVLIIDGVAVSFLPEQLKEFLKSKDQLFGARRDVDWIKDVDQPDNEIASAVARELFFKPFSLTNRRDEPLGLMDAQPFAFETGRFLTAITGEEVLSTYDSDTLKSLMADQKEKGTKSRKVKLLAHQTRVVGDAHMLGHNLSSTEGRDYTFEYTITIDEQ